MSEAPKQAGHRKWRTDEAIQGLPSPETYPSGQGNVPRAISDKRVQEVYNLLVNDVPLGRIKREMARKWSAESPEYPAKERTVERYITRANRILKCDFEAVGGENYWPRSVAYWQARISNTNLSDKQRESAKRQLDDIMKHLSVKKIALTDTKGNDVGNPFSAAAKQMTDEQLRAVAAMRNLAQGAAQPN
jgi:hypothetical protein